MLDLNARQQLDHVGYVLLPGVMSPTFLSRMRREVERLYVEEGDRAGEEFKQEPGTRRLANLVNKGRLFLEVIGNATVLQCVSHVLNDSVKLSSLNARSVNGLSEQAQPLHCDMGGLPDERGAWVCNAVWMLDDFTSTNGALRVIPGSQRWNRLPQDDLIDPVAEHAEQRLVTGPAGSVIVLNAHLWHGGMPNRTAQPRTAVHAFYCRRDKPQQQYQKQLLDKELQASLSLSLRHLLALDDPRNDELSSHVSTRSGFLK